MKKIFPIFLFLYVPILFSCSGRANSAFIPVPDSKYFKQEQKTIEIDRIIETQNGDLPDWLASYIDGGIQKVEENYSYYDKYVFIGSNEGTNLKALDIWTKNFSELKDFTMLAAKRIERRMIFTSSLYPDDEYGIFFETMVKNAYSAEYYGAVKEDTYWIKLTNNSENNPDSYPDAEIYNSFVLLTIDRFTMQAIIYGMMAETVNSVNPTGVHRDKINRLRQTFFAGF